MANGDFYIGQSSKLQNRKREHFNKLKSGGHCNRHLQFASDKYGVESFIFSVVLYCEPEELNYYEQAVADLLHPTYNLNIIYVVSNRGTTFSEEHKRKLSISHLGKKRGPRSQEHRDNISKALKGRPCSPEERERLKQIRVGVPSPNKGKTFSPEMRKKMSLAHIGKPSGKKGTHLSEESKQRVSNGLKLYFSKLHWTEVT